MKTISGLKWSVISTMFALTFMVISCNKKDVTPAPAAAIDKDTSSAADHNVAENTSDDASNMAGSVSENSTMGGFKTDLTACATVTRDTTHHIITVTFNGQMCNDGHTRSGVLTFDYSGSTLGAIFYRHPGFKCVITSTNYVVDGNAVTLSKTIMNTTAVGFNYLVTNLTWSDTVSLSIVKPNGTITFNSGKTRELLNTSDTTCYHGALVHINWDRARVGVSGGSVGVTVNGDHFVSTITNQLVRDMMCSPDIAHPGRHPFIQGTMDFTPGSHATRHFDFGNGNCDLLATVTINSVTYNITLP